MSKMSIRGAEHPIKKIFSDDFVFTIPRYQRAYAWTTEQSEELLQDLVRFLEPEHQTIDDLSPYFLGSIVLIKGEEPDAEVIDGQQRLTTLTMLLSALRSLIKSEAKYAESLTGFLCEKGNVITGTPTRYRLQLRQRDAEFFRQYIQDAGGIEELKQLTNLALSESQRNIRDNTLGFIRELQKFPEKRLIELTQFIFNRCFLIVVSVATADLDSAYRIFSVLNNRGLNLSYPDIVKAEIINAVPLEQQDEYTTKWEEVEALLGSEKFGDLLSYLRAIFSRQRPRKGLIEEFREYVYPRNPPICTPQDFIDHILVRYAHAFNTIIKTSYQSSPSSKAIADEINGMFRWLNQLDRSNWIPPALYYCVLHERQPEQILRFLTDLERLVVSFMICRVPPYKRFDRYYNLLKAMHERQDLFAPNSPLQLTHRECQEMLRILDGDIYSLHYVCRYVLLRLDRRLAESVAVYNYETVSTEHVLPQRPMPNSEWSRCFPTREMRDRYVNKLGNLVLLSKGKNLRAENFDFKEKKLKYFTSQDGISPFALTTQVLQFKDWTPASIQQRQNMLMGKLKELWRL